jgi:hypothetical protein
MTDYTITGRFSSSEPLTEEQLSVLMVRLELELEEPFDMDSERVDWVRVGPYDITVVPSTVAADNRAYMLANPDIYGPTNA